MCTESSFVVEYENQFWVKLWRASALSFPHFFLARTLPEFVFLCEYLAISVPLGTARFPIDDNIQKFCLNYADSCTCTIVRALSPFCSKPSTHAHSLLYLHVVFQYPTRTRHKIWRRRVRSVLSVPRRIVIQVGVFCFHLSGASDLRVRCQKVKEKVSRQ